MANQSLTQSTARQGYNSRYRSAPLGGATIAGPFATPGFTSPFVQGGGIRTDAMNGGTAANRALMGLTRPTQGGFSAKFDRIGPAGPRIDARAQLSPATGRGLADFYANQAMPSEWDRLQNRAIQQQSWGNASNFSPFPASTTSTPFPSSNPFSGGSSTFGGMSSGGAFPPTPSAFSNINQLQSNIQWREKGGPVQNVQPYIVNEKGMEAYQPKGGKPMLIPGPMQMFIPPKDGKIIPHKKTMEMLHEPMRFNKPEHRQMGGPVQGSNAFPFEPRNPWAAKWAMRRQQQSAPSYEQLYQQGVAAGIDMTNAPQNPAALQRYLALGQRSQAGAREGRAAARRSLADSAPQAGPPSFLEYGTGSVDFGPSTGPGMFANNQGEFLPWSVPEGSWQTTWLQDRTLGQAQERSRRSRRNSRTPQFQEAEFTLEEMIP